MQFEQTGYRNTKLLLYTSRHLSLDRVNVGSIGNDYTLRYTFGELSIILNSDAMVPITAIFAK